MRLRTVLAVGMVILIGAGAADAASAAKSTKSKKETKAVTEKTTSFKDTATGMEFVFVKGGCFAMGSDSPDAKPAEKPVHEVCLQDFYIGKYEVTQAQWTKVMGPNKNASECGDDCPVNAVSWDMIQEFLATLNKTSKGAYRLPTEAEWEYAARSGGKSDIWSGTSDQQSLAKYAYHYDPKQTVILYKVGKKNPNALGIYDMSGNVLEWVQDWYDAGYYSVAPKDNPAGPATGTQRVLRGGSSSRDPYELRSTNRYADDPQVWDGDYGFRVVKPVK